MSQAELKKLAELKRLKREAKKKKETEKTEDSGLPKLSAMALPPVMEKRKGGFEIPEFLKQEVKRDLIAVEEKDMMSEALKKQDEKNVDQFAGMSMAEIAAAKRAQTEKQIEEAKSGGGPSNDEMAKRKARLLEQRDKLRKAQEAKR